MYACTSQFSFLGIGTLSVTNPIWVVKTRLCLQYTNPQAGITQAPQYKGMLGEYWCKNNQLKGTSINKQLKQTMTPWPLHAVISIIWHIFLDNVVVTTLKHYFLSHIEITNENMGHNWILLKKYLSYTFKFVPVDRSSTNSIWCQYLSLTSQS